jgi:ATP-binding cassette subfamily B protein
MIKRNLAKIQNYLVNSAKIIRLYYKANRFSFICMFIGVIIVSLIPFAHAYILKLIIDGIVEAIKTEDVSLAPFARPIIFLAALSLLNRLTWRFVEYFERIIYLDFKRYLDIVVDTKYSQLGFEHYSNSKTNDLLNRVKETYSWRPINFANRQLWIMQNVIETISNAVAITALNVWIFLGILISTIPEFIIKMKYGRGMWSIDVAKGSTRRDYWNTSWYLKEERFLEEIRIFGSGKYLINRIRKLYKSFLKLQKAQEKSKLLISIFASLFSLIIFSISEIFIFISTLHQNITIGSLSFYNGRIYRLNDNLQSFFRNLGFNYEDLLYVNDLFKVLELKNEIKEKKKAIKIDPSPKTIEFKNVYFKYPNAKEYALENFSLKINPQEKIALIGENGGGKTTVIRLLCRFFDVTEGEILIDGINIDSLDLNSWYKCIGVLFQEFNIYSYSVKENIHLGDVDKRYEKTLFKKALKKSQAFKFVKEYKHGINTILSKRFKKGIQPSVGQWQKIALARAFFRDSPILILDEPTSAIDAKAEAEIFKQLETFEKDKTVIMISHRFSTVRNADRICVIDKGKILEQGSHDELMKKGGRYEKLFKLQAKGYK